MHLATTSPVTFPLLQQKTLAVQKPVFNGEIFPLGKDTTSPPFSRWMREVGGGVYRVANQAAVRFNRFAMSALPKRFFTPEEYLELEAKAEYKSQYFAGEIFAMSGVQPTHDIITGNVFAGLHNRFRGRPCNVFSADIRVRAADDLYTYPDVMALCGEPKFATTGKQPPNLLNPRVIFEVLSPSTEAFDRGVKFTRCRRLETLSDYVLVSADQMRVEHHWLREDGVWVYDDLVEPGEVLRLPGVGCELPLAEIYKRVAFPGAGGR